MMMVVKMMMMVVKMMMWMMMMIIFGRYDAATEDRQIVWKKMIINFIERQVLEKKRKLSTTLRGKF